MFRQPSQVGDVKFKKLRRASPPLPLVALSNRSFKGFKGVARCGGHLRMGAALKLTAFEVLVVSGSVLQDKRLQRPRHRSARVLFQANGQNGEESKVQGAKNFAWHRNMGAWDTMLNLVMGDS